MHTPKRPIKAQSVFCPIPLKKTKHDIAMVHGSSPRRPLPTRQTCVPPPEPPPNQTTPQVSSRPSLFEAQPCPSSQRTSKLTIVTPPRSAARTHSARVFAKPRFASPTPFQKDWTHAHIFHGRAPKPAAAREQGGSISRSNLNVCTEAPRASRRVRVCYRGHRAHRARVGTRESGDSASGRTPKYCTVASSKASSDSTV